ncbi:MAG TPA: hypothetical protein VD948_02425, partial [Rhodothermales bacterium]|nr:hypothetical protein [Rhodothermales bacterium]
AYTAGVTAGEVSSNEVLGVGIDGDSGPTAWNQWLRGSSFTNITIEDCAGNTGDEKRPGWWLHDCEDVQITNLTISNRGRGPTVSGATGLTLNTCDVRINGYRAIGVQYAIYTKGTPNAYLKNVTLNGETGDGTSAGNFAMYLNHGSAGSNVEIDGLQFDNYNLLVWFGTDFTTAALYNTVKFTDVRSTAGRRYPLLIPARNASGVNYAGGDIVEIDQTPTVTGAREIITPSAANTRNAVVHLSPSDALTGWMMICPLPSTGPCTVRGSGTIEPGDLLVADSNRRAVVSASPAAYTCLGKAISRLASGTGDVEIVPA